METEKVLSLRAKRGNPFPFAEYYGFPHQSADWFGMTYIFLLY